MTMVSIIIIIQLTRILIFFAPSCCYLEQQRQITAVVGVDGIGSRLCEQ